MSDDRSARRVIETKGPLIGPGEPRPRNVKAAKLTDFPGVPRVHLEVVKKLSNPLLMGPPICEELVTFVRHLFTEEEAGLVRHLSGFKGSSEEDIARAAHRAVQEVRPIVHRLAMEKRAIGCSGPADARKYKLMPILPGIFEMVLIGVPADALSDWHRRFAELFELLYDTGYPLDYITKPSRTVRFLPVGRVIEGHPMALPSDRMEIILDQFDVFGVGQCQCRISARVTGQGCGKALGNCISMGEAAAKGISQGWLKPLGRKDVLEIKAAAEADSMVNWLFNVESTKTQHSCSCCGCCCKAMRLVNEFNAPAVMAPPHFRPRFDFARCLYCGKCAKKCPMGSLAVDTQARKLSQRAERCIGCGLCVLACDKVRAIAMNPVSDHQMPYKSFLSMLLRSTPSRVWTAWKVWKSR
jgi:Pyruvate/2-oxoacid:ferredoxin oxidoreductase delta subunit